MALAPSRALLGVPSSAIIVLSMLDLFFGVQPAQGVEQFAIDGGDGLFHALAAIALAAVAQFHRLMGAGRGARRHGGAAESAVFQPHIHFHGRIAPGVQDFAAGDVEMAVMDGLPKGWRLLKECGLMCNHGEAAQSSRKRARRGP